MGNAYPTEAELAAARERFWKLAGMKNPEQGKPPMDAWMEEWKLRGAGDKTQQFIEMNEQRIAQGLPPLNARGEPIGEVKPVLPPVPKVVPDEDDFFSSPGTAKRF